MGCVTEFESKVECPRIMGRRGDRPSMTMKMEYLKVIHSWSEKSSKFRRHLELVEVEE